MRKEVIAAAKQHVTLKKYGETYGRESYAVHSDEIPKLIALLQLIVPHTVVELCYTSDYGDEEEHPSLRVGDCNVLLVWKAVSEDVWRFDPYEIEE